jgi:hypothetical protein
MRFRSGIIAVFWVLATAPQLCAATLALQKDFVKKIKARATIPVTLHVDVHPQRPHRIAKGADDGDIHMAGRADEVRLPLVAEIMNAKSEAEVIKLLDQTSGSKPVDVRGVWRIWFEHPGRQAQIQGMKTAIPTTSNPDHVFEIHPITVFGSGDLKKSLRPIGEGDAKYLAYDAKTAFKAYERLQATVSATNTAVMIASSKAGHNYVEFFLEPVGDVRSLNDALFVLANVFDASEPDDPVTPEPRRMVFVKGTEAADELASLPEGERLHVLGIPRVSLQDVWEIVVRRKGEETSVRLPYEILVVGVFPEAGGP